VLEVLRRRLFLIANWLKRTKGLYLFQRKLGRGGMGGVILAKTRIDLSLVAIKTIIAHHYSSPWEQNRHALIISREIAALSSASHPNICKFIGAFSFEDQCDIVMEYIDGLNLHQYVMDHWKNCLRAYAQIPEPYSC
jgi:eukaryotic-like serine/threonine-protein kinase